MWSRRVMLTLAACVIAGAGEAQVQPSDPFRINSIQFTPNPAVSGRWTPNVMENAKPRPLPMLDPEQVRSAIRSQRLAPREGANGRVAPFVAAGIKPFSANVNTMPLVFAGRLFFSTPEGDATCSAQFIAPRLILTAAHCVQDETSGAWFTNFVFALQYEQGRYLQRYNSLCVAALTGWVAPQPANHRFDYAIIMVDADAQAGYFGTSWNWGGYFNRGTRIGYPTGIENGEIIQVDEGPLTRLEQDGIVGLRHGNTANQHGSSGGAWIGGFASTFNPQSNYAISVTSFGTKDQPGVVYGPYFDDTFKVLYDFAARGCR